jgi:CheY-like chemotaxis protein
MARLLIVSRSMALGMRLADQHDVVEHSTEELEGLLPEIDADVLVLDVGDPVLAVNTVNTLREADQAIPVLLVSGYEPEWEQVEAQEVEGVHVVPLPITRMALLEGITALIGVEEEIDGTDGDGDTTDGAQVNAAGPEGVGQPPSEHEAGPVEDAVDDDAAEPAEPEPEENPQEQPESGDDQNGYAPNGLVVNGYDQDGLPTWARPGAAAETPTLTEPEGSGVRYSNSITRPFDQEPRTGKLPIIGQNSQPAAVTQRWVRPASAAVPAPTEPRNGNGEVGAGNGSAGNGNGVAARAQRLGNRPRKLQRHPGANGAGEAAGTRTPPGIGLVTDPLGPRTDPYGFPSTALDRRLDAEAAALVTDRPVAGEPGTGRSVLRTRDLVRMLHERAGDLYGVSDTAQVLADDVIERADADAAAVLVPDGPIWRVSGGVGLRPLERRLVLEDSHWMITEIGSAGRAVLIEDTDIIRQQLSGAPLAAWRHLLAVPVPDVRAIVVLARGQEGGPFNDRDLSAVIAPVREAAALLAQAVETRRLARLLSPLREADPEIPLRRSPDQ